MNKTNWVRVWIKPNLLKLKILIFIYKLVLLIGILKIKCFIFFECHILKNIEIEIPGLIFTCNFMFVFQFSFQISDSSFWIANSPIYRVKNELFLECLTVSFLQTIISRYSFMVSVKIFLNPLKYTVLVVKTLHILHEIFPPTKGRQFHCRNFK